MAPLEETLSRAFPFWNDLDDKAKQTMCQQSALFSYPKGAAIHDGQECTGVILVKSGCLRVYLLSETGKEVTLYRLNPGDICMLSASCVLQSITFDVFVDAEEDSKCLILSSSAFSAVAENYPAVKIFALETAVSRFSDVMWVMQQILFMNFDRRLAIFLLDEMARTGDDTLHLTHEQIARNMGSAREVVSRMLKYFSSEGMTEVSRKGIKILNKQALQQLAF